jgi:hypothetical protein
MRERELRQERKREKRECVSVHLTLLFFFSRAKVATVEGGGKRRKILESPSLLFFPFPEILWFLFAKEKHNKTLYFLLK